MIMKVTEEEEISFYLKYHYVLAEFHFIILLFYPVYLSYPGTVQIVVILAVLMVALLWTIDKYYPHCKFICSLNTLEKRLTPEKLSWHVILGLILFLITFLMRDYIRGSIWLEVLKNAAIWLFILRKKTH